MEDLIVAPNEYTNLLNFLKEFQQKLEAQSYEFEKQLELLTAEGISEGDTAKNLKLFFDQVGIVGLRTKTHVSDVIDEINRFVLDIDDTDKFLY